MNLTPLTPSPCTERGRRAQQVGVRLLLLIGLLIATPALAQTATPPAPTSTLSAAQATLAALPTYDPLGGTATRTPWATMAWPTLTPVSLVPRAWIGIGAVNMTPGGAYQPPPAPNFNAPDAPWEDTATGFSAINDGNLTKFIVFLIDVARTFYMWFAMNFPQILLGARWLVIIMIVLYGIFYIWKGSKFAPPDAERDENPTRFFFRTFRMGGRYAYYKRGSRRRNKPNDPNAPKQERLL